MFTLSREEGEDGRSSGLADLHETVNINRAVICAPPPRVTSTASQESLQEKAARESSNHDNEPSASIALSPPSPDATKAAMSSR